jgi:type I site-specific restriction endonuclease
MNKKELSERDICTKFITPALRQAGWDELTQLREEVSFIKGQVIVEPVVLQDYYSDGSEKGPRYYQANAVNRTIEAVAKGRCADEPRRAQRSRRKSP